MARTSRKRGPPHPRSSGRSKDRGERTEAPGFIGRDGSPVLDRYPPKDPSLSVKGPPKLSGPTREERPPAAPSALPSESPPAPVGGSATPSKGLIALERPFDLDEFSQLLGETSIRVEVPREDLPEALRRIADFMGFGIYVYSFRVRPAPEELLKRFVIELERVDFSAKAGDWAPFEEKGRSESPFGPTGGRR